MQNLHTSTAASPASISAAEKAATDQISVLERVGKDLAAGNVAANAPAATDREPTTDELAAPGLLETLEAHRLGCERFNTTRFPETDTDTWAAQTYGPHFEALKAWSGSADTAEEAIAALQYASDETGCEIAKPMINAALGYLKTAGSSMDYAIEQQQNHQRPVTTQEEMGEVYDAIRGMQGVVRLARLAIDERVNFFGDFKTIDSREPVSFVEDLNSALQMVDSLAVMAIDIVDQVISRTYGAR